MILPKRTTIGDLYKINAILTVPRYQRNFDWGKSQVLEMMTDLETVMESEKPLFLGTFVFDVSDPEEIKIVDGQQRITSFTLLLIAARQKAKNLKFHPLAQEIQKKISFTNETTGEMISERVIVSSSISDVFKHISQENWDGVFPLKIANKQVRRQTNKLKGIYDFMYNELNGFNNSELSKFLGAVYSAYAIEIDLEDELEAFDIFERTNARGMTLNVADKLKNYLYANSELEEDTDFKWKSITENSGTTLQRMLKYYWVSGNGYVMKSDLYRELRTYGDNEGPKKLTDGIYDFSNYYSAIQSNEVDKIKKWLSSTEEITANRGYFETVVSAINGLNHFKITQHIPLIYSITESYKRLKRTENDTKYFLLAIKNIERYHFINNQICDRVGNEVEKPYADFSKIFSETDNFIKTVQKFNELLNSKIATQEEFESRFTQIDFQSTSLPDLCYIFNTINNYNLKPSEWVKIYDPDDTYVQNHYNREHLLSQKPEFKVKQEDMEVVDNIGNLFIISRHLNSRLQNKKPAEKLELLRERGRKFKYIIDFIDKFEKTNLAWGKKQILERASQLSKLAYNEAWKIKITP